LWPSGPCDITKTRKDGTRGRLRFDYGQPSEPEAAIRWLWKLVDAAKTPGELYGRTLVVIAAEQYAARLVLPSSQRSHPSHWGSHKQLTAKALKKLAGQHLPASLTRLERAVARAHNAYAKAERARYEELEAARRDAADETSRDDTMDVAQGPARSRSRTWELCTARERPDVALVGLGKSSKHALDLIDTIVQEAACPVIVLIHAPDPAFVEEASKLGIFAYITDSDVEDWQSSIDIVLRRFTEYHDLEGAFGRRAVTERAKGILMERHSIDEEDAFELLRDRARSANRKLVDIATAVVES
jgi:AmiR/NasT family two-component response regulator